MLIIVGVSPCVFIYLVLKRGVKFIPRLRVLVLVPAKHKQMNKLQINWLFQNLIYMNKALISELTRQYPPPADTDTPDSCFIPSLLSETAHKIKNKTKTEVEGHIPTRALIPLCRHQDARSHNFIKPVNSQLL